jgi:hypothetical protein
MIHFCLKARIFVIIQSPMGVAPRQLEIAAKLATNVSLANKAPGQL